MRIHVHKDVDGRKVLTVEPGRGSRLPPVQFQGETIEEVVDAAMPVIADLLEQKRRQDTGATPS